MAMNVGSSSGGEPEVMTANGLGDGREIQEIALNEAEVGALAAFLEEGE